MNLESTVEVGEQSKAIWCKMFSCSPKKKEHSYFNFLASLESIARSDDIQSQNVLFESPQYVTPGHTSQFSCIDVENETTDHLAPPSSVWSKYVLYGSIMICSYTVCASRFSVLSIRFIDHL
jgi:hypothetical protein